MSAAIGVAQDRTAKELNTFEKTDLIITVFPVFARKALSSNVQPCWLRQKSDRKALLRSLEWTCRAPKNKKAASETGGGVASGILKVI